MFSKVLQLPAITTNALTLIISALAMHFDLRNGGGPGPGGSAFTPRK